ncbi:alpha/beta fold hydrolase [Labrenzia sp. PHM005]|uniref:alpha/beta fold hydrolase n=1 Tax=Labrenzia sp. PHM005 TaxID=2590016 RepID=UPI0011403520|nr:alpha/beta fold hydrolase [Labrenzia sp. PHM005]QDG76512.1 alpha/beta fold hydrolase [Labrenzia sp. PHM005]
MCRTIFLAACIAAGLAFTGPAPAQELDGNQFRAPSEGSWYHPIDPETWLHVGGRPQEIAAALTRIKETAPSDTLPDDPSRRGAGSWIETWTELGKTALAEADDLNDDDKPEAAASRYRDAFSYFLRASSPHTNDPEQRSALSQAWQAYEKAGQFLPVPIRKLDIPFDGEEFSTWLHLPKGDGPFPVVIVSMGSDVTKEELLPYFIKQLAVRKIAMLSLDMPGNGGSTAYSFSPDLDKLHAAAALHLKTLPEIDGRNIFVQGASFGGTPAARAWAARPDLDLAGVIYMCGPLHRPFMAPPDAYSQFPAFTMDGVRARLGLDIDASFKEMSVGLRPLSLKSQGLFEGPQIDTPLLAILTNRDPVAPLGDVQSLMARGTDVTLHVTDEPGHCPQRDPREAIAASWITGKIRD